MNVSVNEIEWMDACGGSAWACVRACARVCALLGTHNQIMHLNF